MAENTDAFQTIESSGFILPRNVMDLYTKVAVGKKAVFSSVENALNKITLQKQSDGSVDLKLIGSGEGGFKLDSWEVNCEGTHTLIIFKYIEAVEGSDQAILLEAEDEDGVVYINPTEAGRTLVVIDVYGRKPVHESTSLNEQQIRKKLLNTLLESSKISCGTCNFGGTCSDVLAHVVARHVQEKPGKPSTKNQRVLNPKKRSQKASPPNRKEFVPVKVLPKRTSRSQVNWAHLSAKDEEEEEEEEEEVIEKDKSVVDGPPKPKRPRGRPRKYPLPPKEGVEGVDQSAGGVTSSVTTDTTGIPLRGDMAVGDGSGETSGGDKEVGDGKGEAGTSETEVGEDAVGEENAGEEDGGEEDAGEEDAVEEEDEEWDEEEEEGEEEEEDYMQADDMEWDVKQESRGYRKRRKRRGRPPTRKANQDVQCTLCKEWSKSNSSLFYHVQKRHKGEEGFQELYNKLSSAIRRQCTYCGKVLHNSSYLKEHIEHQHTEQTKECKCNKCDKVFKREDLLKAHDLKVHSNVRYPCTQCSRVYRDRGSLSDHTKIYHTHKSKFECPTCGKFLSSNKILKRHMQVMHEEQSSAFQCPHCEKIVNDPHNLARHIKLIHTPDHVQRVSCQICGKTFSQKGNLNQHMINVHNIAMHNETYVCNVCDRSFQRKTYMYNHMKSHPGEEDHWEIVPSEKTADEAIAEQVNLETLAKRRLPIMGASKPATAETQIPLPVGTQIGTISGETIQQFMSQAEDGDPASLQQLSDAIYALAAQSGVTLQPGAEVRLVCVSK